MPVLGQIGADANVRLGSDSNAGDSGPWYRPEVDSQVHGLFCHDSGTIAVELWRDVQPSRGENFAEQDAANHPTGHTTVNSNKPVGVVIGDTIWAIYPDASNNLKASAFSRTLNAWGRSITSSIPRVNPSNSTRMGGGLTAVALPGEKIRVIHNSTLVSGKDTVYFVDIDLAAGSFGSQTILHAASGSAAFLARSALVGAGGITHAFYVSPSDSFGAKTLYHRSISVDGLTLGTEQAVHADAFNWDIGDVYSAGAVRKLAVPFSEKVSGETYHYPSVARADSETDPVWTTENASTDPVLWDEATHAAAHMSCAWLGGKLYLAHEGILLADVPPSGSFDDLSNFLRVHDGVSWGPSIVLSDQASTYSLTPRIRASDTGIGGFVVEGAPVNGIYAYLEVVVNPCEIAAVARPWPSLRRIYTGR